MEKIINFYYGKHLLGMLALGVVIGSIFIMVRMIYIGSMLNFVIYPLLIFLGIIFGFTGFKSLARNKRTILLGSFLRSGLLFLGEILGAMSFGPISISFIFYVMPVAMMLMMLLLALCLNNINIKEDLDTDINENI